MLKNSEQLELKNVRIDDKFWSSYIKLAREVVIPYQWEAINDRIPDSEPSHAMKNFRIAAGLESGEFFGMVFQDSDVSKWLEAVGYSLTTDPDPELEALVDGVIDILEMAQQPDGYLNTYFILKEPKNRWTNLAECHELYCAGHFIEAAVAYYKATNKIKVIDIACRFTDHIDNTFGPEEGKIHGYDGHQEIELALVKLYKVTGNERYLKLSNYFLNERGKEPNFFDVEWEKRGRTNFWPGGGMRNFNKSYHQAHMEIYQQETAEGHAVRLVYMCIAMADVAAETGNVKMFEACKKLWLNIITKRMYITGGIGSTSVGEAFTFDYDLPNDTVYTETCASIGLFIFAHKMSLIEPKGIYADIMERALYNNIISGMSLDGKGFFYVNPLEVNLEACEKDPILKHVKPTRQKWFACACCPPNITRVLTSLGQYIYTANESTVYVNLYIGGEARVKLGDLDLKLEQITEYPWDEIGLIRISLNKEKQFKLALRIPGWCSKAEVSMNNEEINLGELMKDGYAIIDRVWKNNDEIKLVFKMPVLRMRTNPIVKENIGKAALQRGPFIYCLEEEDNGQRLHELVLPKEAVFNISYKENLLGGVTIIEAEGKRESHLEWENELYKANHPAEYKDERLTFIPYYAWANRSLGEMSVWVREK